MKPAVAVLLVSAAYLGIAWAEETTEAAQVAESAETAQVDPNTGKVWDGGAMEWVSHSEFVRRVHVRASPIVAQVPFLQAAINDGLQVLDDRIKAVERHYQHMHALSTQAGMRARSMNEWRFDRPAIWGILP